MGEVVKADDSGTIEITVDSGKLVSLRISNQWRDRFDAETLASTLSQLIRDAMPERQSISRPPTPDYHLPLSSVSAYLAEVRAGREASKRYVQRARAGKINRPEVVWREDLSAHVHVAMVGARFHALGIDPEWAGKVSIQAFNDTLLEVMRDIDLTADDAVDPDLAESRMHYAQAKRYLVEK